MKKRFIILLVFLLISKILTAHSRFCNSRQELKDDFKLFNLTETKNNFVVLMLDGRVYDLENNLPLIGVKVDLYNEDGSFKSTTYTNRYGLYLFEVESNKNYIIYFNLVQYEKIELSVSTNDSYEINTLTKDVGLTKKDKIVLKGVVIDTNDLKIIQEVDVLIFDNLKNEIYGQFKTNKNGLFTVPIKEYKLKDKISFNIKLSKEGYISNNFDFNHEIMNEGVINLGNYLVLNLYKTE